MYYNQPSNKKEKLTGFEQGYKFKEVSSIQLTRDTNVGGWERQEPSKNNRVLIVKKGTGTVKIQGKSHVLEQDVVLEVPQGVLAELDYSQLEYFVVKSTNGESLSVTVEKNEGGWKAFKTASHERVLIVKDGIGFAKINHKTVRLDENDVIEIPANAQIELSGPFEYFFAVSGTN